jgi:chemotaxis signal transduction protein
MTAEAITQVPTQDPHRPRIGLRILLATGLCSIPLDRVHHLAAYATLTGAPDDYFCGWLDFRGHPTPVFDLNRVVCDQPTLALFSSRIIVMQTPAGTSTPYLGLLAPGITDTIAPDDPAAELLNLDHYLPMLYNLIPDGPLTA